MGRSGRRQHAQGWGKILLGLVCILLVAVFSTVQVAHTHADADTHANCSLCVAAHVTLHLGGSPSPAPAAAVVTVLETLPRSVVPSALQPFALFTRPPPVVPLPS